MLTWIIQAKSADWEWTSPLNIIHSSSLTDQGLQWLDAVNAQSAQYPAVTTANIPHFYNRYLAFCWNVMPFAEIIIIIMAFAPHYKKCTQQCLQQDIEIEYM
jgi:hypothetical protein